MKDQPIVCGTCRSWDKENSPPLEGLCHRYPPRADAGERVDRLGHWPLTMDKDWCDEWQLHENHIVREPER